MTNNQIMEKYISDLDEQILDALRVGATFHAPKIKTKITRIVFCGMGGSAIGGDILRCLYLEKDKIPFIVCRAGRIPKWVDRQTLVIVSSYSGNTRETLEAFQKALSAKGNILIITSGGKLERLAKKNKIPFAKIPTGFLPRCAVGYLTFVLIPILRRMRLLSVNAAHIQETISLIQKTSRVQARAIAKRIFNRSVHFYASHGLMEPVIIRWRAQLAENAKTLASHHWMPEVFHNEVEGWSYPRELIRKSAAIFFTDKSDPAWIRRKYKSAQRLLKQRKVESFEIKSVGKSMLARIFSLISLGDWVSFELAKLYKTDPVVIPTIEALKKIP